MTENGQAESHSYEILTQIDLELLSEWGYHAQVGVEDVVILAHTHCLPSTYYLLRTLVHNIGIPAEHIVLLPKPYSTIPSAVRRIGALGVNVLSPKLEIGADYDQSMKPFIRDICSLGQTRATKLAQQRRKARVILIDDGGLLTRQWLDDAKRRSSFHAVSILQTRSGVSVLGDTPSIPVINVAQSAAKRKFESHLIADAIIKKMHALGSIKFAGSIGVFGLGMIGRAIAKRLLDEDLEVYMCDEKAREYDSDFDYWDHLKETSSRKVFVNSCDLIFGTTSASWLKRHLIPRRISREKIFVSCSSREREFQSVIHQPDAERVDEDDRYSDILWHPREGEKPFCILNGGFPINFDRRHEWERPEEIALTRVLILAAVLQAICTKTTGNAARYIKLDPNVQQHLVRSWLKLCDKSPEDFSIRSAKLDDVEWWAKKSAGEAPISYEVLSLPLEKAKREAGDSR